MGIKDRYNRKLKKLRKLEQSHKKLIKLGRSVLLQQEPPKSEQWFHGLWEYYGMKHPDDQYNAIKFGFIPDVLNEHYQYIIEVDGSIHERPDIIKRDKFKENIFNTNGYKVFRVMAYNHADFMDLLKQVKSYREDMDVLDENLFV